MRDKLIPIIAGILFIFIAIWMSITDFRPVHSVLLRLDSLVYDLTLKPVLQRPISSEIPILIIDLDEKSLRAEGRWPWPRNKIATLVEKLQAAGVVVIAFDMTFTKPEANIAEAIQYHLQQHSPEKVGLAESIAEISQKFDNDAILADALSKGDIALGVVFNNEKPNPEGALPPPIIRLGENVRDNFVITTLHNYRGNLPMLQQAAGYAGFITTIPDNDGVLRRTPLVIRYNNDIYPSLALETARLYLLEDNIQLHIAQIHDIKVVESVRVGKDLIVATDATGQILIPYHGPGGSFPYVSATDVLHDNFDPKQLEGSIVFIGTTALGLADLIATPVDNVYPGVEAHANVTSGILNKYFIYTPDWAAGAEILAIIILGLTLPIIFAYLSAIILTLSTIGLLTLLFSANLWLLQSTGIVLSPVLPAITILALATIDMIYGFLFETRRRQELKHMFGQYVPPAHVDEMSKQHGDFGFSGETREMTVLFADIRNFTGFSEHLSAVEVKELLNRFFTPMTQAIFNNDGTIDKYVGDMVMAFWGAPLEEPEHAKLSINTAFDMIKATQQLNIEFAKNGLPEINIGVGINTGIMNVGDMGSTFRRSYTVIGDAVNLASRMEGLTKYYGVNIVVSEDTALEQKDFVFRKLDRVAVKGKTQAVKVFQPMCIKEALTNTMQETLNIYHKGLEHYFNQNWNEAGNIFDTLNKQDAQTLYKLYLDRINAFKKTPPPKDWDGITVRQTK